MVISILNTKGGAGKSTTAVNIASAYATLHKGKDILLIDLDVKQRTTSLWSNLRQNNNNLTVVAIGDENALKNQIDSLEKKYDLIFIDGTPHQTKLDKVTIGISDFIIIPVAPYGPDVWAAYEFIETVSDIITVYDQIKAYTLFVKIKRIKESKETIEAFTQEAKLPCFENIISDRVLYPRCLTNGLDILDISTENKTKNEKEQIAVAQSEIILIINELTTIADLH